jgi:hypothetical protein
MANIVYAEQGYADIYPHSDFEGPCTCSECCRDEANGYYPTCAVCMKPLRAIGLCKECVETLAGKEYMIEH